MGGRGGRPPAPDLPSVVGACAVELTSVVCVQSGTVRRLREPLGKITLGPKRMDAQWKNSAGGCRVGANNCRVEGNCRGDQIHIPEVMIVISASDSKNEV